MALFKYKAIDDVGKNYKGSIEANNKQDAINQLQKKKYYILNITQNEAILNKIGKDSILKKLDLFQPKVSIKQRIDFTRQFASLIITGVPYYRALQVITNGIKNKFFKSILTELQKNILEGKSLSISLKKFSDVFSPVYVALVQAGELSGSLGDLMNKQANFDTRQYKMQSKIRNALLYPAIMSCVALGIIIFLIKYILPKILPIFEQFETVLPLPTRVVVFLSDLLTNYGGTTFVVFLFIVISINLFLKSPKGKIKWDFFLLKIPVYNTFLKKILNYRFVQVLSTLLSSGVDLKTALEIGEKITGNAFYEKSIKSLNSEVTQKGFSLSQGIKKIGLLDDSLIQIIKIGEESGNLEPTLEQAAENLEFELQSGLDKYIALLEPIIILVMAVFVGFIILSVLLPMFQLNQLI